MRRHLCPKTFTTVFDFRHLQRLGAAGAARRRERRRHDVEPRGARLRRGRRPRGGLPEAAAPKTQVLKVLVLGDPATGKTSIIKRYVHNFFSNHHRTTVGVDFALKQLTVGRRAGAARVGSARRDGARPQGHDGAAAALGHRGPGPLRRHRARAAPRRRTRRRRSRNCGNRRSTTRTRSARSSSTTSADRRRSRPSSRAARQSTSACGRFSPPRANGSSENEQTDRPKTSRDDRDSQVKWKDEIDSKVHLPNGMALPVVLLANKCDLEDVALDRQELDDFCRSHGFIGWFETSAKADVNIDTAARRPRPAGPSPGNTTRRVGAEPRGQHPQPRRRLFGETRGADEARQDDEAGRAGGQEPQRGLLLGARLLAPRRARPTSGLVSCDPRSPCARRAPRLLSRTRPTRPPPPTRRSGGAAAAPSRRRRGASRQ